VPVVVIGPPLKPNPVVTLETVPAPEDVDTQLVPLDCKTFPELPGANVETALEPLPTNKPLAANVVAPVPPEATPRGVDSQKQFRL